MRALEVLTMLVAGAAGAAVAATLAGASLVLVLPAVVTIGLITIVADRARRSSR